MCNSRSKESGSQDTRNTQANHNVFNDETGGFHIFEFHMPTLNFSVGAFLFVLLLVVAVLGIYYWIKRIRGGSRRNDGEEPRVSFNRRDEELIIGSFEHRDHLWREQRNARREEAFARAIASMNGYGHTDVPANTSASRFTELEASPPPSRRSASSAVETMETAIKSPWPRKQQE